MSTDWQEILPPKLTKNQKISDSVNDTFRCKVNKIQSNYTKEQTLEIEMLLFDLYNLTDKEHKVIGFIAIT